MTGVVLLNLGGPDTQEAVRPFLYNLFGDRRIIRLGPGCMQKPLAWLISTLRAGKTKRAYALIGGGSPILRITQAQAEALEEALGASGPFDEALRVYVGMRYWRPFIGEAVERACRDGAGKLIALSLYPQYSKATSGSSEESFKEAAKKHQVGYSIVPSWFDFPPYIEALADTIKRGLERFGGLPVHVLFSAHSLPVRFIEEGDPYVKEVEGTIEAAVERVGIEKWSLCYQSRSGPVKWIGPSTEDALKRLSGEGVRNVLMVPVSFVSDHIETLYEMDMLYKGMASALDMRLERAESLNTHPLFINALRELVLREAGLRAA